MGSQIISLAYTLVIFSVFFGMTFSYTEKRAHRIYATGKVKASSVKYFSKLSKVLFVSSMVLTMLGFWYTSPYMLPLFSNSIVHGVGVSLVGLGYVMLGRSFNELGKNYSPMFDAFLPRTIVTSGVYQHIRHPIYLYNLCVSFGLAIASGLGIVLINSLVGCAFVLRAIQIEERYLSAHFPEYADYKKRTRRLIPFVF